MTETDARYLQPYRDAIRRYGAGFRATLWANRDYQRVRFDMIASTLDLRGRTVVDAGCGAGDFARFLLDRGVEYARYVGVDAVEPQIEEARARHLPRAEFKVGDLVKDPTVFREARPDVVVISGTLNTMREAVARGLVLKAFAAATEAVAFNFLSDRPHRKFPRSARRLSPAKRFRTVAWVDWALKQTPRVAFRQDYLDGHDATIVLWRGEVDDENSAATAGG